MYNFEKSPKCTQYLLDEVWCLWYLLGPSFGIDKKKKEKNNPAYFKTQKQTKNPVYIKTHLILNKKPVSICES